MESQPQNPEFRIYPENFQPCRLKEPGDLDTRRVVYPLPHGSPCSNLSIILFDYSDGHTSADLYISLL